MKRIFALTPSHRCDAQIAIAACRAGQVGILDLGTNGAVVNQQRMIEQLKKFAGHAGQWGIRWDSLGHEIRTPLIIKDILPDSISMIVVAGLAKEQLQNALTECRTFAEQVIAEVLTQECAMEAQAVGYDGVILKGNEAGGAVSPQTSFLLLQQVAERLTIPYWVQGGMCMHTAPAALMAGAQGVVLSEQLWLMDEAPFNEKERNVWSHLDGSETVVIGRDADQSRFFNRSGKVKLEELSTGIAENSQRMNVLRHHLTTESSDPLIPMGQDIAFAASLADQYGTVGRTLTAFQRNLRSQIETSKTQSALAPDSPLAQMHHTQYPIVQGPMTRVSDVAPFAKAVGDGGGLPFLALAVLRESAVRPLLHNTQEMMGDRPWGVGILGFVPPALRQEQLAVIKEVKPPFAIISGGRPHQARELETQGISTYLHVPSPGLLAAFAKDGTRKFIFEGNECGGHTGPRSSFILWGLAVDTLLQSPIHDYEDMQILFAGGIHDALSAAMVSVIASPLVERGVKIGVLMGTAYLFTKEIVEAGAIVPEFQSQAVNCKKTDLLNSGLGYSTRCAHTPFCDDFNQVRDKLIATGNPNDVIREELESFNLGRLRIASKGITRSSQSESSYTEVDRKTQIQEGMYMIGDVATLRNQTLSIADLHAEVSLGGQVLVQKVALPKAEFSVIQHDHDHEDIAIVGMAAMFPKAPDVRSFWHNILTGVDAIEEVSPKRWDPNIYFDDNRFAPDKTYSKWGGFLGDVQFNPIQYGLPPVSLPCIDATQLLALEVSRLALKDAGYLRLPFPKERTSVIFGTGGSHDLGTGYGFRVLLPQYLSRVKSLSKESYDEILASLYEELPKWTEDSFPGILANVVSGRVANRLDLGGSNFTVEAACASSLAALDVGIDQLRLGKTDVALVGTVDCTNNPVAYMSFAKTHALSPRGRCRPFDASADGIVISEGVAALVLRRLSDAERDGDRIYAVVKGVGSSSDGRNRSLTAPHPDGQVRAVRRAYEDAGVLPETVELVEAHGTGTSVGDKSEIEALKLSFDIAGTKPQYCAIGSVKSMIGHTKMAAGLAGIIKGTLAVRNHVIPPTIGVENPNSTVSFGSTPFYIGTETEPWFDRRQGQPRRCGVSAFGFGGTNFHAVLEEYQGTYQSSHCSNLSHRDAEIFVLGCDTRTAMQEKISRLRSRIEFPEQLKVAALAKAIHEEEYTKSHEGKSPACRLAIVANSVQEFLHKLELAEKTLTAQSFITDSEGLYYQESQLSGRVCFLFTGQGSQKVNMGRELLIAFPELQEVIEEGDAILESRFSKPLSRFMYPIPVFSDAERKAQQVELNNTHVAQPGLAAADLLGFEVLKKFGLQPDCVGGHSFGEFVALCAAGCITSAELFHVAEVRGRISSEAAKKEPGTMAAVQASEQETQQFISELQLPVHLANMNAPAQTIIAGPHDSITQAVRELKKKNIGAREIPVTAPFHTPGMSGAGALLGETLQHVQFREPSCPVYSNTLGGVYPQAPEEIRKVLVRHICEPVRFMDEVQALYVSGVRVFIEVGPGRVLGNLVGHILKDQSHVSISLEGKGRTGTLGLCDLLAQAWAHGLPVEVSRWFEERDLPRTTLNELLEQARANAHPPATIWRINGGSVSPWSQISQKSESQIVPETKQLQGSLEKTIPPVDAQVETRIPKRNILGERKVHMDKDNMKREQVFPQSTGGNHSAPIISQIQASMNQFMDLQRNNQLLMQRYLDLQEQLIEAAVDGRGLKMMNVDIPADHHMRIDEPVSVPVAPQPLRVPPAPVLPILKETVKEQPKKEEVIPQTIQATPIIQAKDAPIQAMTKEHPEEEGPYPSTENFKSALLQTVSERTGYPKEMLDLHANLEADLGIDSIKLIEILTTLEDYREMLEGQDGSDSMEELTNLRTLQDMVDWYDNSRKKN